MNLLRCSSAVLLVAQLAVLAACSEAPRYDPLPDDAVVLVFGDSVTHGTGAGRGEDFPSRLAALSGWRVVNAGIPGDTALAATGRIGEALADAKPDLVLIELGGNDFLRRRAEHEVKEDLRTIIRAVRAADAIAVLVGVPQLSAFAAVTGRLSDSPIYAQLAGEERVFLIDRVFADVLSDDALRADRIHPNAAGYRVMAEHIAAELARAGLLSRW
jgi:acyl-CoA thioesterase I